MWWRSLSAALVLAACGQSTPVVPPPVAGLAHPQFARVGTAVTFDASTTAVASEIGRAHV